MQIVILDKRYVKILFFITLIAGVLAACTKNNTSPQPGTLNSVDSQLLGTWYVWQQVDSQFYYNGTVLSTDTSKTYYRIYTNFSTSNYIEFKPGAYNSSAVALGNLGLQCIDHSYGLASSAANALPNGTPDSTYWFYDNVNLMQLQIGSSAYYIISLTSDSLVLRYATPYQPGLTQFNYNRCYLYR